MKSLLPTGKSITKQANDFGEEALQLTSALIAKHVDAVAFRDLFRTALAANHVLENLRPNITNPQTESLRNLVRRIPLLILLGQTWVAKTELRRFLEITLWSVYFTHHPVEWAHFNGRRGSGHSKDMRKPIGFAAHRDMNSYIEYALEYFEIEPSGLATKALAALENDKGALHGAVHAGHVAREPQLNPPADELSEAELRKIAALSKRVFANCLIVLCAFDQESFDRLPAGARLHFDWLVGESTQKKIRSGSFGLKC